MTVSFYGVPVLEEGITWSLESEKTDELPPPEPTYVEDPTLDPGTEVTQKAGTNGSRWITYKIASKIKLIAIDEMRHAEQFAERIKELGGEPNSELSSKITKGQKVMDVFPFNVKVEDDTIETYNKLLEICRTNGDSVSARLFERILDEEQVHDNYFCNMANHIETLGNTYLSKIAGSDSPEIPSRGFVDAE